jgi:hypothetical protein
LLSGHFNKLSISLYEIFSLQCEKASKILFQINLVIYICDRKAKKYIVFLLISFVGLVITRANPMLVNAAQTIGVDIFMNELEANNAALSATFKARELEDGKQAPSGSDLRPAATDSYNRFCSIIEQAANFTPNRVILDLFIKMDMLRKRYHALQSPGKDKGDTPSA